MPVGGDDTLTGGSGSTNNLYGDAGDMWDSSVGGNDTLISGTGTDNMWGDAYNKDLFVTTGADTFVFTTANGNDTIYDFENDKDLIDVSGYGFAGDISGFLASNISDLGDDTLINFGGGNTVTLVGFADPSLLTAADFIFV